jgi:adenylosuccinate lyase
LPSSEGKRNDMLERLAADKAWPLKGDDLRASLDPSRFIGRAAHQVDDFLGEVIGPILSSAGEAAPAREEVRV